LNYFYEKKLAKAAVVFENIYEQNHHRLTAHLFLNKSAEYITKGVPDDLTGVEVMHKK